MYSCIMYKLYKRCIKLYYVWRCIKMYTLYKLYNCIAHTISYNSVGQGVVDV